MRQFAVLHALIVITSLSAGTAWAATPAEPTLQPVGAGAYYRQVLRTLDELERQLPAITAGASAAAQWYVEDATLGLGADGNAAFVAEAQYRSGGVMAMLGRSPEKEWRGVLLYCLREDRMAEDLERLALYRRHGCRVILFGSTNLLQQARVASFKADAEMIIPAAVGNGLFRSAVGTWVTPTYETAAMATLWVWTGEFVAACTRHGSMPPMYQSIRIPTGKERNAKLRDIRFQAFCPPAAKEGELALRWLAATRNRLSTVRKNQSEKIVRIAKLANEARHAGHRAFAITGGHGVAAILGMPHDGGLFIRIDPRTLDPKKADPNLSFQKGDFLLVAGYDHIFNDAGSFHLIDRFREAGGTVAFCIATYRKDQIEQIRPADVLLDTGWEYGDADVDLSGYEVKILPTSGILTATIFFMIDSELLALTEPKTTGEIL